MAPVYKVILDQPAQSDSESEYEMIRDDESIEVLDEPGASTDDSRDSSVSFLAESDGQDDTDSSDSESGPVISDSDVRVDPEESDQTDTGSIDTKTGQATGDSGAGTDPEESEQTDTGNTETKTGQATGDSGVGTDPEESEQTDAVSIQTKTGEATGNSGVLTDPEESEETDASTGEESEDITGEVVELIDDQEKNVHENQKEANNGIENQEQDNLEEDSGTNNGAEGSSPKPANSVDSEGYPTNENVGDIPAEVQGAVEEIISEVIDKLAVVKLAQQLETDDAATPRFTDTKSQHKKEDEFESENAIVEAIELDTGNKMELKCLDEIGIIRSDRQYIKKKAPMRKRIDQLGFSARLIHSNLDIKLHNEGCLMTADDNFLAKVRILDSDLLGQTNDFDKAKKVLLQKLQVVHVMQDDLMTEKMTQEKIMLKAIETALKDSIRHGKSAVDFIPLAYMMNTHGKLDFCKLCEKIKYNHCVSQELRQTATLFLQAETRCNTRGTALARFGYRQPVTNKADLLDQLKTMLSEYGTAYRKQLLEKAPICLYQTLSNISNDRIMFVQSSDVKLFSDLAGVLDEKMFQKPLADLATRWTTHVAKIKFTKLLLVEPQTNPIFYFLAKSLEDLIIEITSRTDHTIEDLLISNHTGWHPIKKITWKSENVLTKCLEREYFFIFKLLKHFDLGFSNEKKPFEYDVKLFEGPKQRSTWRQLVNDTKKFFGYATANGNSLKIADEKYVWYCLLDDVLYHILPADYKFDSFEQIIQNYINFLNKAGRGQLETLRVMTHNTARFIVQTMSYVIQKDNASIDGQILQKQLDLINEKTIKHSLTSNSFRDLVDVFNIYWKNRDDIIGSISFKIRLPQMESLKMTLLEIVSVALEKNVTPDATVSFFRTYSDLLADLNDVQFDWYVKAFPDVSMGPMVDLKLIKLMDNKWANTDNRTYSVEAVEKFAKTVPVLFDNHPCPKHYVLEILLTMLSLIKNQLQKTKWSSELELSEMVQINTTNELIFAVRNSFLYLKEQSEYVSFEMFFDERVKPFVSAVDNSSCHRDFTNRIYLIKESFWYIRKQNEMDIDKALELFAGLNEGFETEVLRSAYQKYSDAFQKFMEMSSDVSEITAKANHIVNQVKEITFVKPHQTWNSNDKLEKIPEILAGLAAVWSILVSKDVSSTGKYLTPHCIQALCILRMLSIDRAADGVVNHLSQVLTGQGKSLVLGLTAALLALTGHKPRIVCYNRYLVKRDRHDFEHFISLFDLSDSIIYSTFEDMANDLIAPVINGERMGLRSLIEQMLLGNDQPNKNELVAEDMRQSVLLIDEVDVFFTSQFYGSQYYPAVRLMLPGLDLIQQKIWNIVSQRKCMSIEGIVKDIYSYINSEEMKKQKQFYNFINDGKYYQTLAWRQKHVNTNKLTNKQLFDEHLKEMIECALAVSTLSTDTWHDYKLSARSTILCKQDGRFENYHLNSYYPVFNYFRLRGSNFNIKVGQETNYGYFNLSSGSISYAILPKNYPLILGVSGTLADLNQYEKHSIKNLYNVKDMSLMPTYFGGSNLDFHQSIDFRVLGSIAEWKTAIFARVNAILGAQRSVLVFFQSDLLLNSFRDEYCSQFDRLNVLTENTEQPLMNQYIDEAGVAKTITLATSAMGRGVDYKSSVAIEKHGGLHVIQTFFSLDVKEETQIKGRTARKDNHGSYELITCKAHLDSAGFWGHNLNYRSLHEARLARASKDNERILNTINECQQNHDATMNYMKSFFKH
ncbi:uncharacterized protein LOC128744710 [Sabethes cyaneus]|uniref:uncharacterized protein LOC128744710 n=1 Tax=Sabethes cyaneus TaxID=53552 RepID=UPI00237D7ED4|nr:uncharacterized protein LOC128744710 [Sabethes cyaneus]